MRNVFKVVAEGFVMGATFVSLAWIIDDAGWFNLLP